LVISNIKIQPNILHTLNRKCQPTIDASKASCPARNQILVEHLAGLLPAERKMLNFPAPCLGPTLVSWNLLSAAKEMQCLNTKVIKASATYRF
jgi:hypothetical protein